jgi:threonine dehydrogenase-like Zn-dependent dehydrogenase
MVKPGDREVIPTHEHCGVCVNCAPGLSAHHGALDDAPDVYRAFDQHADGVTKAVLHP